MTAPPPGKMAGPSNSNDLIVGNQKVCKRVSRQDKLDSVCLRMRQLEKDGEAKAADCCEKCVTVGWFRVQSNRSGVSTVLPIRSRPRSAAYR
jgi:hypothetical protein